MSGYFRGWRYYLEEIVGLKSVTILFWRPDSANPGTVYAGLTEGLAVTHDNGSSWGFLAKGKGKALGMFVDAADGSLYVAFADGIYLSTDGGSTFPPEPIVSPPSQMVLHRFAGGRHGDNIVLAYVLDPSTGNGAAYIGPPDKKKCGRRMLLWTAWSSR
jgi:hypothetical protein